MKKLGLSFNILLLLSLLFGAGVMAISNNFDIWTDGYEYIDQNIANSTLKIIPKLEGTHSNSELSLKLQNIKTIGSNTEKLYYTTLNLPKDVTLPLSLKLFKSNAEGDRVGSRSEGELLLDVANKEKMSGSFFNNHFEAFAHEL